MSEIPDDVAANAGWIESCLFSLKDEDRVAFIARAIMAERERCAKVIEETDLPTRYIIAAAIRKGE